MSSFPTVDTKAFEELKIAQRKVRQSVELSAIYYHKTEKMKRDVGMACQNVHKPGRI